MFGRRALITYEGGEVGFEKAVGIFVHEIGHLFGAVHFDRRSSVMYKGSRRSLEFDEINKELILKKKYRNFKEQPEEN